MQVVTVQANLVQCIQCHPPQFPPDHTQQTLEMLFTFHLALLVQETTPVQIRIGEVIPGVMTPEGLTPEGPTLEQMNLEENHMRVVRQVQLEVEDTLIRALLVRGGRVVQLADH